MQKLDSHGETQTHNKLPSYLPSLNTLLFKTTCVIQTIS